jgi:hypothetical protein
MVKVHRRPGVEEPAESDAGTTGSNSLLFEEQEICDRSDSNAKGILKDS